MIQIHEAISEIRRFYIYSRRAPTVREIAKMFNYKSVSGAKRLADKLVAYGVLDKDETGTLLPKMLFTPIQLVGSVKAGFPAPSDNQIADVISFDQFLVNNPEGTFVLKVSGDSMIDAGIHDGDLVCVEKHRAPNTGDIVIAYVDGGWTLKYFAKADDEIKFLPANSKYEAITPKYEALIGGVVVSQVRKYY